LVSGKNLATKANAATEMAANPNHTPVGVNVLRRLSKLMEMAPASDRVMKRATLRAFARTCEGNT
jgi:hypothetical protein